MSGRYRCAFSAGRAAVAASVSPALKPSPKPGDTHGYRSTAGVSGGCAGIPHSTQDDGSSNQNIFYSDDPRTAWRGCFCLLPLTRLLTFSVSVALRPPLPLSPFTLPVLMPRVPLPPLSRLSAAVFAAVSRHGVLGPEAPPTALQQADATPRAARTLLRARTLSLAYSLILWMI